MVAEEPVVLRLVVEVPVAITVSLGAVILGNGLGDLGGVPLPAGLDCADVAAGDGRGVGGRLVVHLAAWLISDESGPGKGGATLAR